jgi:hypothetical protein
LERKSSVNIQITVKSRVRKIRGDEVEVEAISLCEELASVSCLASRIEDVLCCIAIVLIIAPSYRSGKPVVVSFLLSIGNLK